MHGCGSDGQPLPAVVVRGRESLLEGTTVKKIGVLFGMENTFPGALVERINSMNLDGVVAEFVQVGGVKLAKPAAYAVIIDRISHDIPFYRAFLKHAVLNG
jgi:hypothetical protein